MPNDDEFASLPLDQLRSAALTRANELGCERAELRVEQIRTQILAMRDARVEGTVDDRSVGMGLRVIKDGSFGFAATIALSAEDAAGLADVAVGAARIAASAGGERVELAGEPSHGNSNWVAPHKIDPTSVPLTERVSRLEAWSAGLLAKEGVDHVTATLMSVTEDKYYGDTSDTIYTQRRVRLHPSIEALSVGDESTGFETMRTTAPPAGRGFEYLDGDGWDFEAELERIPEYLAEKLKSPSVEAGTYDLVIDPTNLWLTIHESVGHATELDRALGYEAAYAGTSFATFDKLGSLKYGSELMNVTGDRTVPYGLATVAYDDEGVEAQSFDIVKSGVLVGYQLDRRIAKRQGFARSNGCAFADSPLNVPIQRMANISLRPAGAPGPTTEELISGVERGLYIVGDKSWSIDMQRYNFQFTGQRFHKIENGTVTGQVRDAAYQATTTDFWGSLAALGGESTYLLCGAFNCGKGQPGQVAPVGHGAPAAVFEGVRILNVRAEAGR